MYTTQFTKWGPEFNKNGNSDGTRAVSRGVNPRTRPRRANQYRNPSRTRSIPLQPRLPDNYERYRGLLSSTEVYVYGLFDSFDLSADLFSVIVPVGTIDHSTAWQQIGDEFFGFTTLLEKKEFFDAQRTYSIIYQRLNSVVGAENDYGMIIKLWPICIRLLNTAILYNNHTILWGFLHYMRDLAAERYNKSSRDHPIPKLLNFLCQVSIDDLLNVLQLGYLRTIHCLENRLDFGNALVLSTWSNYMKKCQHQALSADVLTSRFAGVLQAARCSFTPTGTKTLEILHDYMYAAYYNAEDHQLTWSLALETVDLAGFPGLMGDQPSWCLATQGYALAVKLMYTLSLEMDSRDRASKELRSAIVRLGNGDRECRTRALMLTGMLESRVNE